MIPFFISGVLTLAAYIWMKRVGTREVHHLHLPFMCENPFQVKMYGLQLIRKSIPFLGVIYNSTPSPPPRFE